MGPMLRYFDDNYLEGQTELIKDPSHNIRDSFRGPPELKYSYNMTLV
jgi:hypothetical protein